MNLSLKTRLLALAAILFLIGGAATQRFFVWLGEDVQSALGMRLVERNALYGKSQILAVISRDVLLVQHLAESGAVRRWIQGETDTRARAEALAELDEIRRLFRSRSYFLAFAGSGSYYFHDDAGGDATVPRYRLSEANQDDGWFYATLRNVRDLRLNVDTDRHLGLTRVWINAVVRDDSGRPIAVAGTGVDLTEVIRTVIDGRDAGVTNLLLDPDGAIQAHQDVSMIDFASARKAATDQGRRTVFPLIDDPSEQADLRDHLRSLSEGGRGVTAVPLTVQGRRLLAGIAWVPEIRWFVVTLANPDSIGGPADIPQPLLALFAALALTLVVAGVVVQRTVVRRLSRLDESVRRFAAGHHDPPPTDSSTDEIGRLTRAFGEMSARVVSHTEDLERQVAERTAALANLALTDHLTGCLNRRGMIARLEMEWVRHAREGRKLGILLVDVDRFKDVNDRLGHSAGDAVLTGVAGVLRGATRPYDAVSRWGGEEFLIGAFGLEEGDLETIAEKLRASVAAAAVAYEANPIRVTISVGAKLADLSESLDKAVSEADKALYEAKATGRDRVVIAP